MSDVKDILGLSRPASDGLAEAKPKGKGPKAKRPEGMSREAFALLGDSHPITPTALANELKGDDKVSPIPFSNHNLPLVTRDGSHSHCSVCTLYEHIMFAEQRRRQRQLS